ncbi:hypothetical protein NLU13_2148 [Sarocladium strictum]|uniref:Uncharacterized protein n=1 Tax=Sarocladium strictum TaxID=5046 RepID=A0AA39GTT8_SARSR|nr:hypothetical protein NLU13_2148 [Sarocladium strictum]
MKVTESALFTSRKLSHFLFLFHKIICPSRTRINTTRGKAAIFHGLQDCHIVLRLKTMPCHGSGTCPVKVPKRAISILKDPEVYVPGTLSPHGSNYQGWSRGPEMWHSHNNNDEEALPDGVLPPLRSQAAFQPNNATPVAALPPLQQDLPSSLNSRQRSETSSRFPATRHSMSDAILPRIEAAMNMPVPSSASLHSFTRTERPTSRPHRGSRTQALDVQRPIFSLDIGSSSRLPSTGPSPGTSSGVASSSPRRQRPSRTGPRRHMAAPRSPSHAHGRHSIDRSLVQEFLDSQNIGPADRIGNYTYPVIEELMLRNLQALHGSMGHAKVARKSMVKALAHVPVEDLPEDERTQSSNLSFSADPETCLTVFRGYDRGGASQSPPSMWRQPLDPGEPSSRALNPGRDSVAPGIDAALHHLTPSSDQQLPSSSRADRAHPLPLDR